jgi:RecA-family ATPase
VAKLVVRTLKELLALPTPETKFLIEPSILAQGGNMFVYGTQETLKSWIVMDQAFAISTGTPWLGLYKTQKSRTLLLQTEQTEFMYRERVKQFMQHFDGKLPPPDLIFSTDLSLSLDNPFGLAMLESAIAEYRPDNVILDNLYHVTDSLSSEENTQRIIKGLGMLQQKYTTTFTLATHTRKTLADDITEGGGEDVENMFGSSKYRWWADTIIKVSWDNKAEDILNLDFQKNKNAQYPLASIRLKFHRNPVRLTLH